MRGAPAIGLTAAFGVAMAARCLADQHVEGSEFRPVLPRAAAELAATRPTAVNLFWALERMRILFDGLAGVGSDEAAERLLSEARDMLAEDEASNRAMGRHGAALIPDGANILTHCNAGALATGAYGTALGVIQAAHDSGKHVHVWVDETRPLLQGARLTAWELREAGIPHTLITDNMAGHFMQRGSIDLAMVGADRIVANGDGANKIGTYYRGRPRTGAWSAVLFRSADVDRGSFDSRRESHPYRGTEAGRSDIVPGSPDDSRWHTVANPAFDVTPARLVTAIVTERGVARAPFTESLRAAVESGLEVVTPA